MPVDHLGPDELVTADPETSIDEVVDMLERENVGVLVIADDNEPVGIVTDRDIALAATDVDDIGSLKARELMTDDPVTLGADEEAIEISRTIDEHGVRRIPTVDDDGELTGIVTMDDLVATIGEQLDNVAETIEVQSPDYRP